MPKPGRANPDPPQSLSDRVIKWSVVVCLVSILFGMIVMVKGVLLSDGEPGEGVSELFVWMGFSSCGLFTFAALTALVVWAVRAISD